MLPPTLLIEKPPWCTCVRMAHDTTRDHQPINVRESAEDVLVITRDQGEVIPEEPSGSIDRVAAAEADTLADPSRPKHASREHLGEPAVPRIGSSQRSRESRLVATMSDCVYQILDAPL